MSRILALTALIGLGLSAPALAGSPDKPAKPAAVQAGAPAPKAPPQAPPRKATAQERAEGDRLEPLARAAFWSREVEIDGRDAEAGVKLAGALRALDRNDEASLAANRVLVIFPDNRAALMETARDSIAAGQGFFALDPLKRLQVGDPRDWQVWSLMGVAYEQVGRTEEAEACWRQALDLSPDNAGVLSNLAMHFAAKGDRTQAETLLRRAAAAPGATLQVRQNLALVLGLEGKLAEAEQIQRQDLPPELASANMAYLRAAGGGGDSRSWKALQGAQAASN